MTLQETEEIVKTLEKRHSGLNEAMLATLLRAGGWEEKAIQEAHMLFRARQSNAHITTTLPVSLPPLETVSVFPAEVDGEHLLLARNEEPLSTIEPQSLVVEDSARKVVSSDKKAELPHNLPLRPFETSEHIWPFSRYKDVFYGDISGEVPLSNVENKKEVVVIPEKIVVPPSAPQAPQAPQETPKEHPIVQIVEKKVYVPVYASGGVTPRTDKEGDEKLVIMACVMLLAILLLLGYMYSNGRL